MNLNFLKKENIIIKRRFIFIMIICYYYGPFLALLIGTLFHLIAFAERNSKASTEICLLDRSHITNENPQEHE
jgi:hypothetical protein